MNARGRGTPAYAHARAPRARPPTHSGRPRLVAGYPAPVPDRFPPPGPSWLREQALRIGEGRGHVSLTRPSELDDWWLAVLWVADDDGIVRFRELAPAAGPPPEPPLMRLGPAFAGALSGLILEEDGRLAIRLAPVAPPDDPARPWGMPAVIRAAFKFEPLRSAAMRDTELGEMVLTGFRRAVESLARP